MKVTFPHMGNLHVAMKSILREVGLEMVIPPEISRKTLNLGAKHSPEFACFPLKVNIGNFIEALDEGADTIIMAGGFGPCRFGYYSQLQKKILSDLGYDFRFIIIEPPRGGYRKFIGQFRDILKEAAGGFKELIYGIWRGWKKMQALDELEKLANRVRATERNKGATTAIFNKYTRLLDGADTIHRVGEVFEEGQKELKAVQAVESREDELRIGLVGEIYVVLEPNVNLHVERSLGHLGAQIFRSIYISDWLRGHFHKKQEHRKILNYAHPYLKNAVGGHGLHSIGHTAEYAQKGFDGVIQLLPFTCMPEIVAQSILPEVSREYSLPTMTLIFDEQTGEGGIQTRLEAFVDLIRRKKLTRKA